MKLDKKNKSVISNYLMYGAAISVILSAIGWLGPDIWLASTQWLLVAVVLGLFAVYLRLS